MIKNSLLIVPGYDKLLVKKALISDAICVILDLQTKTHGDVASRASNKLVILPQGRSPGPYVIVGIHQLNNKLADEDVAFAVKLSCPMILLPNCNSLEDIGELAAIISVYEARNGITIGQTKIIAQFADTALSVLALNNFRPDSIGPRLKALCFQTDNLKNAIGATKSRNANSTLLPIFEDVRHKIIMAAAAAKLRAIDDFYPDLEDMRGLKRDTIMARKLGFAAKLAIDPSQLAVINQVFSQPVCTVTKGG